LKIKRGVPTGIQWPNQLDMKLVGMGRIKDLYFDHKNTNFVEHPQLKVRHIVQMSIENKCIPHKWRQITFQSKHTHTHTQAEFLLGLNVNQLSNLTGYVESCMHTQSVR